MGTHEPSQQLGFAFAAVHATRRELARTISSLANAADERVPGCYNQLVAAVEHAFRAEELVTEAIDQDRLREQQEGHARALSALHQAANRIDDGDAALAREALGLLGRFLIAQRDRVPPLKTGPPGRCPPSRRAPDR
ncbi:hypothetical protein GCM10027321_46610 [Massilia terrae]|uniref:Hemerythrin-like domain-containing protein n=1 Tax=Massilia terrae TaxID=1811224 RepID=A0ABT2CSD5_9BURK|nr:hypothetical protein [Massilia terrae]MCS0656893.1 hypothetical protein [Massilia terrae]